MSPLYQQIGIKALVFDFDGTLSRPTLDFTVMRRRALEAMARHIAVPDRPELPVMELLDLIGDADEVARNARDAALNAVREVEIEAAEVSGLFPFVRPMLAALREKNLEFAIITRNCPEAVRIVFPDVDEHCRCLLTRDDVPQVKPDPDHLLRAVAHLNLPPAAVLTVGDHPMDVLVGKRAGTLTAAVTSGEKDAQTLQAYDPDYLCADVGELAIMLGIT